MTHGKLDLITIASESKNASRAKIGRGQGDGGVRNRVLAHIRGWETRSPCLHEVIRHFPDRVWVRWEETDDEDAEGLAFDDFEHDWGEGFKPPCVERRAWRVIQNPGSLEDWIEDWLDDWPGEEDEDDED